jgi:pyruvate dehydrogenase E2 component (dihydrolipoamide acetyltransferase)
VPVEVILPKVDMDMSTGRISKWHVAEGQAVSQGELLFEIETDKAAMEIDSPATGVIRDIVGAEDVDIPVGQPVAWIYVEGEAYAPAPAGQAAESVISPLVGEMPGRAEGGAVPPTVQASSARREIGGGAIRATPLARRLARERGLDLAAVRGSGPHGRIVRADVEGAHTPASPLWGGRAEGAGGGIPQTLGVSEPPPLPPPHKGEGNSAVLALFEPGSYEMVPHDAMRRTIARRLVEAKSTIPHFYLTAHCDIDALLRLRTDLNAAAPHRDGEPAWRLSVNDMVVKAIAVALVKVPAANVSWTDEAMLRHRHADVGVAVSIPGGLITPIVRRAEEKSLSAISNETKALAERARARALRPEEYRGGTTAVSNLGMFGVSEFAAIVNPPHATILAVGAGERRAVVDGDLIRAATMMTVTLSTDHRAVDGALAAELLAAFRETIEHPLGLVA